MNDCYKRLLDLSNFNLSPFTSQYNVNITEGRDYNPTSFIKGYVNVTGFTNSNQVYSNNCFSLECFSKSGIWSSKAFNYIKDTSNCLAIGYEGCYEEYKPICSVLVPYSTYKVYEEGAFEEDAFELSYLYRNEYREDLCYAPSSLNQLNEESSIQELEDIFDVEIYGTTTSIHNKYTLKKDYSFNLYPYEEGAFEEDAFTFTNYSYKAGTQLVVSINSPYEPGVYNLGVYRFSHHVSVYNPSNCLDECTLQPLEPIVVYGEDSQGLTVDLEYNCQSNFPSNKEYLTKEGVTILVEKNYCLEDTYIPGVYEKIIMHFNMDYYPYEEGAFEEGVYVDRTLIYSSPLYAITIPSFCCPSIEDINGLAYKAALLNHHLITNNKAPNSTYYPYINQERKEIFDCSACYKPTIKNIDGLDRLIRFNGHKEEVFYTGVNTELGVLVVDIGYIYPKKAYGAYEYIDLKNDIPINIDGTYEVNLNAPLGIKAVKLKAITKEREIYLGMALGDNPLSPLLIKTFYRPINPLLANIVNVEDISISLILLSLSGYRDNHQEVCNSSNNNFYYIDPYIKKIIKDNFTRLSSLLNPTFPYLPNIVNNNSTYDSLYIDRVIDRSSYEEGVYKPECDLIFNDTIIIADDFICSDKCFEDDLLILPPILNTNIRYLSWLLISYITFCTVFPEEDLVIYKETIDRLGGILLEIYQSKDLLDNENSNTSDNIMVCLALLKLYEFTLKPIYLNRAADIYVAINHYLYVFNEQYFLHDLGSFEDSIESSIYGLIFSIWTKQDDKVEALLKTMLLRKKNFIDSYRVLIYKEDELLKDIDGNDIYIYYTNPLNIIQEGYKNIFIPFFTRKDDTYELDESIRLLVLLDIALNTLNQEGYSIGFDYITHLDRYKKEIIDNDYLHTSTWVSYCLTNYNVSLNDSLLRPNVIKDLETLLFNRKYITTQLKHMIPTGFGWFHESAFNKNSNLGSLLRSVSYNLSIFYPYLTNILNSFSLTSSNNYSNIDKWANDLELRRWEGERYEVYKERVKLYLLNKFISVEGVYNIFNLYGIKVLNIQDFKTQSFDTYTSYNQSSLCSIVGNECTLIPQITSSVNTLSLPAVFIEVNRPILRPIVKEVKRLTPIGVKVFYKEKLEYLTGCSKNNKKQHSLISINIPNNTPYIIDVSPLCCIDKTECGYITYKITLSHITSIPLYLYFVNGAFEVDKSIRDISEKLIVVIPRFSKEKLFLFNGDNYDYGS